jgi:uncharacterized surface protein with fasciclin (FAS1) repeats
MKMKIAVVLLGIITLSAASALAGSKNPMVGGQEMYPTKDIIDNAVNSADHTTLVAAVKAAGLVDTLKGPGPFTVFAPTNEAFAKLPAGTVETLLKPENKDTLTKILTYHVVAGRLSALDLKKQIKAGNGQAELKTVSGGTLVAMMQGKNIVLKDEKGLDHHDSQCFSVERGHPCGRQCFTAQLAVSLHFVSQTGAPQWSAFSFRGAGSVGRDSKMAGTAECSDTMICAAVAD